MTVDPRRARDVMVQVLILVAMLCSFVVLAAFVRRTWTDWRGWSEWPRGTATVVHNEVPAPERTRYFRPVFEYEVAGRTYTRTSPASDAHSPRYDVGTVVEQAYDPADPSRGVTLYELHEDLLDLGLSLLVAIPFGVILVTLARKRSRRG